MESNRGDSAIALVLWEGWSSSAFRAYVSFVGDVDVDIRLILTNRLGESSECDSEGVALRRQLSHPLANRFCGRLRFDLPGQGLLHWLPQQGRGAISLGYFLAGLLASFRFF